MGQGPGEHVGAAEKVCVPSVEIPAAAGVIVTEFSAEEEPVVTEMVTDPDCEELPSPATTDTVAVPADDPAVNVTVAPVVGETVPTALLTDQL